MSEFASINFIPPEFISAAFTYASKYITFETVVNIMSTIDYFERTKESSNFISKTKYYLE